MIDDIEQYSRYSPFMAAVASKDESHREDVFQRYARLPEEIRAVITDVETAEKIQSWEAAGTFPPIFAPAVAKLIGLAILGIITLEQVPELLTKLRMDPAVIRKVVDAISTIVRPALAYSAITRQPASVQQEMPATKQATGHILDLRKPQ